MAPRVVILMADYGNDPTETATPFTRFTEAGFEVSFATESGNVPTCDVAMLEGITAKLLGAAKPAIMQHDAMIQSQAMKRPQSWTSSTFSLDAYDLVFLPGGHDKGMQQIIKSASLHAHLASYLPKTKRGGASKKAAGAVCHGVQVLAEADAGDGSGKSAIHDFETTSLTKVLEGTAFWATRAFLGDYYKTFGYGTDSVETVVRKRLDDPEKQYKSTLGLSPFVHEDPNYYYISGRWPGDAELLSKKLIEMVKGLAQS